MQDPPVPEPSPLPRPTLGPAWREGPLDRVRRFATDPRVGAIVLVLVALAAGVAWYHADVSRNAEASVSPATQTSRAASTSTATQASASSPAATDAGATGEKRPEARSSGTKTGARATSVVVVHVAGAVVHPGVVQLKAGSRVIDALEAVGGGVPGADLDRLNLAAKLTDGERVAVPKLGEQPPVEIQPDGAAGGGVAAAPTSETPLDLNSATLAQLDELPGIGPSLGAAIIAERTKRGGFQSVNDLRSVRGIGDGRFADLAPLVHVG